MAIISQSVGLQRMSTNKVTVTNTVSNKSHRAQSEGYFEWWYFHFVTNHGPTLNVVLHETDIFGLIQKPYLSLSLFVAGKRPRYFRRELTEACIGNDTDYLKVKNGMVDENDEILRFSFDFRELEFSGIIRKRSPSVSIGNGILYEDRATGRRNFWSVQIPLSAFEGVLKGDDKIQRIVGWAYQDHNWGTIPIQEFVSDWVWGHFSNADKAVFFHRLLTQNGALVDRAALVTPFKTLSQVTIETAYLNQLLKAPWPEKVKSPIEVSFPDQQTVLRFVISSEQLMRSRVSEKHNQFLATYCRWSVPAQTQEASSVQDLRGVTEYIRIRRVYNATVYR